MLHQPFLLKKAELWLWTKILHQLLDSDVFFVQILTFFSHFCYMHVMLLKVACVLVIEFLIELLLVLQRKGKNKNKSFLLQ